MIEDAGQHGINRLKAAQLASELAKKILRASKEGVLDVRHHFEYESKPY